MHSHPGMWNTPYQDSVIVLKLHTIPCYYFLNWSMASVEKTFRCFFFAWSQNNTRGHTLKINIQSSRHDCKEYFFLSEPCHFEMLYHLDWSKILSLANFKSDLKIADLGMYRRGVPNSHVTFGLVRPKSFIFYLYTWMKYLNILQFL